MKRPDVSRSVGHQEDGRRGNAEMIRQEYGCPYTRFTCKYLEPCRQLEREAREAGRGLWGAQ
jgi:endonuclease YncB( thermonuclease family)